MPNVISIENMRPHLQGQGRCAACKYEWRAVTPVGVVTGLECPNCGRCLGHLIGSCSPPEGDDIYTCNCGSEAFYIDRRGVVCWVCGERHIF